MTKKITNNKIIKRKLVDDIRVRDLSQIPNVEYRTKNNVLYFGLKLTFVAVFVFLAALIAFSRSALKTSFFFSRFRSFRSFLIADFMIGMWKILTGSMALFKTSC